ncbi:MAG: hypothetical protein IKZ43_06045 [Acidaminococcaceae bacterium]|nr:hypothetical protein [Acidaminococcaceae bacterium]
METARVFYIGESQEVCLPKEYQFEVDEVYVIKIGNVLLLVPDKDLAAEFENGAASLSEDENIND